MSKQCEGTTASGDQCRRRIKNCERYCQLHNVSPHIALPSYVSVTPEDRFWVFFPEAAKWKVGLERATKLFCPGSGSSYAITSYVSEGSYGVVYFGTRIYDGRRVAIKIFKEIFRKESRREPMAYDFMKEYYMHRAVADRISEDNVVVKMLDSFFVRTGNGLHGCIVMEKMDGCLLDLFEAISDDPKLQMEAVRLWTLACRSIASSLVNLHKHKIYHLDIKPGNVLFERTAVADGIVMKLVDLGLSCYIGGTPIVPCVATGSYLPPEWRENGDKNRPTFERVRDPTVLEMGETYSMCVSFSKMLKHLKIDDWLRENKNFLRLLRAIEIGRDDDRSIRYSITTKTFINLTQAVLDELNTILPPTFQGINMLFNR